jgi:hypothetical protein
MTHPHERALEAAARALCLKAGNEPDLMRGDGTANWTYYRPHTIAAVTAYIAALQETHALVPREATEEMESAFFKARDILRSMDFPRPTLPSYAWSAMIDAAPPAAQEKK